jgi:hypothetical protein
MGKFMADGPKNEPQNPNQIPSGGYFESGGSQIKKKEISQESGPSN